MEYPRVPRPFDEDNALEWLEGVVGAVIDELEGVAADPDASPTVETVLDVLDEVEGVIVDIRERRRLAAPAVGGAQ